jgi:molybdopterin-guanine dinucleotide biosynthesis protein A
MNFCCLYCEVICACQKTRNAFDSNTKSGAGSSLTWLDRQTDSTRRNAESTISNRMINASGFVTAGGRSSRMGRDKAWLEIAGRPLIDHVLAALKPVTSSLAIIANNDEYKRLGLPVYADTNIGVGPLEAIRTALANSPTPYVVLAGCDMPFLTSELFSFLLNIATEPGATTGDSFFQTPDTGRLYGRPITDSGRKMPDSPFAVVPLNEDGKPEPLCALYPTEALETVTRLIASGVRKVGFLFERIPTRLVGFDEIKHLQNARLLFENINTQGDYERAVKKI